MSSKNIIEMTMSTSVKCVTHEAEIPWQPLCFTLQIICVENPLLPWFLCTEDLFTL